MGGILPDLEFGGELLHALSTACSVKGKVITWMLLRFKTSVLQKTLKRMEMQFTYWVEIFAQHISAKGLISKIKKKKELFKFSNRKANNLWKKDLTSHQRFTHGK